MITTGTVDAVRGILVEALGLQGREGAISEETPLFGSMPEFDSLAIVEVVTLVEERFGFDMDEDDITGEVFETVGSLAAYVEQHRA